MATKRSRPLSTMTTAKASAATEVQPSDGAADVLKAIAQLQERVTQLEMKLDFVGFDCFYVTADAESASNIDGTNKVRVKIDHPLTNSQPNVLFLVQPTFSSRPVQGCSYNEGDGHWYLYLSPFIPQATPDWGHFAPAQVGYHEMQVWQAGGTPEDFQRIGGNARVLAAGKQLGDSYLLGAFIPKAPIPAWVKAVMKVKAGDLLAVSEGEAKGMSQVEPKTVPPAVLGGRRQRPK